MELDKKLHDGRRDVVGSREVRKGHRVELLDLQQREDQVKELRRQEVVARADEVVRDDVPEVQQRVVRVVRELRLRGNRRKKLLELFNVFRRFLVLRRGRRKDRVRLVRPRLQDFDQLL